MAKVIQIPDLKYVRLTQREMSTLRRLKSRQTFYHVNLDHIGSIHYPNGTILKAVELVKSGIITKSKTVEPEINVDNSIDIELVETKTNIKVSNLQNEAIGKLFLFDNPKGLFESLVDRYSKVLNITADEISKMNCYIRKFVII